MTRSHRPWSCLLGMAALALVACGAEGDNLSDVTLPQPPPGMTGQPGRDLPGNPSAGDPARPVPSDPARPAPGMTAPPAGGMTGGARTDAGARPLPSPADAGRPSPGADALTACKARVEAFVTWCRETQKDPALCAKEAEAHVQRCLAAAPNVGQPPAPPPPDDRVDCKARAERAFITCLEAGNPADSCRRAELEHLKLCAERPMPPPPPPPSTDPVTACKQRGEAFLAWCRENQKDAMVCEREAVAQIQRCIAEATRPSEPKPTPRPDDRAACKERAERAFLACLKSGQPAEVCRKEEVEHVRLCAEQPTMTPPRPADPGAACKAQADAFVRGCVEKRMDRATCEKEAAAGLERCLTAQPPPPPPRDPVTDCKAVAERSYLACVESGQKPDACRMAAIARAAECAARAAK